MFPDQNHIQIQLDKLSQPHEDHIFSISHKNSNQFRKQKTKTFFLKLHSPIWIITDRLPVPLNKSLKLAVEIISKVSKIST